MGTLCRVSHIDAAHLRKQKAPETGQKKGKAMQFIKVTGYDNKPLYLRAGAIYGMRRIEDAETYTRVHVCDGKAFSVRETLEEILESLGYQKGNE